MVARVDQSVAFLMKCPSLDGFEVTLENPRYSRRVVAGGNLGVDLDPGAGGVRLKVHVNVRMSGGTSPRVRSAWVGLFVEADTFTKALEALLRDVRETLVAYKLQVPRALAALVGNE